MLTGEDEVCCTTSGDVLEDAAIPSAEPLLFLSGATEARATGNAAAGMAEMG